MSRNSLGFVVRWRETKSRKSAPGPLFDNKSFDNNLRISLPFLRQWGLRRVSPRSSTAFSAFSCRAH